MKYVVTDFLPSEEHADVFCLNSNCFFWGYVSQLSGGIIFNLSICLPILNSITGCSCFMIHLPEKVFRYSLEFLNLISIYIDIHNMKRLPCFYLPLLFSIVKPSVKP